jgi:glutamate-ammonia-ligase adenylyltransferase
MTFRNPALARAAQRRWEAVRDAAAAAGRPIPDLPEVEGLRRASGLSAFVARSLRTDPETTLWLLERGEPERTLGRADYRRRLDALLAETPPDLEGAASGPSPPPGLGLALRRFRGKEMVRIAWRDLAGLAELEAVLGELSALADVCIDRTLDLLFGAFCRELGTPAAPDGKTVRPVVIGMGKLGAEELNFSSDVDLIFAFPESGATAKGISSGDFFTRLFRMLMKVLSTQTPEGFVFRVDTNLRPFGEGGPLASSFGSLERYYQSQGREWERYAWIKARPVAGDLEAGRRLIASLRPFVYRRYLDFGVFEALREMKRKIALEVRRQGMERNVKLGAGGIREVEFFGQIFQLIRGGVVPDLQQRGILGLLEALAESRQVDPPVCEELGAAYRFLRRVENRLQADEDRQTHDLPADDAGRVRLAEAMGFPDPDEFESVLAGHRERVHRHFSRLLESESRGGGASPGGDARELDVAGLWQGSYEEAESLSKLEAMGFDPPPAAYRHLSDLRQQLARRPMSVAGQQRLERLMPKLLAAAAGTRHPVVVLGRLLDLVRSVLRRTNYLALLIENPMALDHLVRLTEASSFIAAFVARRPVLLDELLDPRTLYAPPRREGLSSELSRRLSRLSPDDLEECIEDVCVFRQSQTLRIAAADVSGTLPLMRVSDHLSDLAEVVLSEILRLAWSHLVKRHGPPSGCSVESGDGCGFAVIAFGKLGGLELAYGSDLDLVFLHAAQPDAATPGPQAIDAPQYYARLGQRMIHILTTHTRAGRIYEVDMRLRPSGNSGTLVSHIGAYESYLAEKAWTWEHQALIRARAVAGDPALCDAFEGVRRRILAVPREPERLREEVAGMRERLRTGQPGPEGDGFDLKQGAGGIVDIEFLVQFLVLSGASRFPGLVRWSDNVRQLESLVDAGLLDLETAHFLREAYLTYRSAAHRLHLQDAPAVVEADRFVAQRNRVAGIYARLLG